VWRILTRKQTRRLGARHGNSRFKLSRAERTADMPLRSWQRSSIQAHKGSSSDLSRRHRIIVLYLLAEKDVSAQCAVHKPPSSLGHASARTPFPSALLCRAITHCWPKWPRLLSLFILPTFQLACCATVLATLVQPSSFASFTQNGFNIQHRHRLSHHAADQGGTGRRRASALYVPFVRLQRIGPSQEPSEPWRMEESVEPHLGRCRASVEFVRGGRVGIVSADTAGAAFGRRDQRPGARV